VTENELMRPENEWAEVVNGVLVEIETDMMGLLHTIVIHNLYDHLKPFAKANKLGYVHGDGLKYILHVDENGIQTSRTPDLAFLRSGRRTGQLDIQSPFYGAPDLAVEVASPGQTTADMLDKAADFLRYGTEEVWIIYPVKRELHRYQGGEEVPEIFTDTQSFVADFFPGLPIVIADLFVVDAE
jgi:Uma2 family endonuclease